MMAVRDGGVFLTELKAGEKATILKINAKDRKTLNKLMALGVLPGMQVTLMQKFPSLVFKVGNTRIAADEAISKNILVLKN
ncbi:MAG: ferrous iron transport protein [Thermoanaerobacteraceae bacterium]|jgi:Fe2+ transport system protein FeoA|nr:FeoA family protein [Biomaibacter acetigenes]MDK2879742.1 ferrous iron transport protein [Thermoanaerobacteraceae bacterium]MDN5302816.1 ferrous iron transport protein [Thermoanaerobacteraceae bacterium]MDN5312477.1 ferrous iron transport protein [Thermoanaerobacteraceae bacterium]